MEAEVEFREEQEWIAANRHHYVGQWIALQGSILLASGTEADEVFSKVHGVSPPPLLIYIEEGLPFAGW